MDGDGERNSHITTKNTLGNCNKEGQELMNEIDEWYLIGLIPKHIYLCIK